MADSSLAVWITAHTEAAVALKVISNCACSALIVSQFVPSISIVGGEASGAPTL